MNEITRVCKQLQAQAEKAETLDNDAETQVSQGEKKYKALWRRHDKRGSVLAELRAANDTLLTMTKTLSEERDLLQQKKQSSQ